MNTKNTQNAKILSNLWNILKKTIIINKKMFSNIYKLYSSYFVIFVNFVKFVILGFLYFVRLSPYLRYVCPFLPPLSVSRLDAGAF